MKRPVIIVDPLSSGVELAPAFKKRGIPAIAVTFKPLDRIGFGTQIKTSDFIKIIPQQPNLENILRQYNPLAVIPGSESGVPLASKLAAALTPEHSNDINKSQSWYHKARMQEELVKAGIPSLKTLVSSSTEEVETWISTNRLTDTPLIVKPPVSAGSDKVFHIPRNGDWDEAFNCILNEPSKITGQKSESVIIQEQAIGTEYAVGTVSANGKHSITHLIKYNKTSITNRETVFDHVEFIPFDPTEHSDIFDYTQKVLDALGIRWGASHTELMLTNSGPRLIETGARMLGGPTVGFSREATGSSQADKLVEAFVDGEIQAKVFPFKKTVVPVFLKAIKDGVLTNVEVFDEIKSLPTLLNQYVWLKNGDTVKQTVDYLTSAGIVALSGDREQIFEDYKKIRTMESRLIIS